MQVLFLSRIFLFVTSLTFYLLLLPLAYKYKDPQPYPEFCGAELSNDKEGSFCYQAKKYGGGEICNRFTYLVNFYNNEVSVFSATNVFLPFNLNVLLKFT